MSLLAMVRREGGLFDPDETQTYTIYTAQA
jgi:hypothetical protein